jgi:1-acyl-sn-glycerol-3-phosphate acyltransferase
MHKKTHNVFVYTITRNFLKVFSKVFFRIKVAGREHIPARGAFIVASNHASWLDPIVLAVASPRRLTFLAKSDLFKGIFFKNLIRALGAFSLPREGAKIDSLKQALSFLEKGAGLVVFPEGTRSKDGNITKPTAGLGFLSAKSGVPVVPAYIHGSYHALPAHASYIRPHPIKVVLDAPLYSKDFAQSDYQGFSDAVFEKIHELKRQCEKKR